MKYIFLFILKKTPPMEFVPSHKFVIKGATVWPLKKLAWL